MVCPDNFAGLNISDRDFSTRYLCEGRKARPTPMDLRSIPVEVHAFESHPSHFVVHWNAYIYMQLLLCNTDWRHIQEKTLLQKWLFMLFSRT